MKQASALKIIMIKIQKALLTFKYDDKSIFSTIIIKVIHFNKCGIIERSLNNHIYSLLSIATF